MPTNLKSFKVTKLKLTELPGILSWKNWDKFVMKNKISWGNLLAVNKMINSSKDWKIHLKKQVIEKEKWKDIEIKIFRI